MVESHHQILECPIVVGDLSASIDFGHEAGVEICLQQCLHCVPVRDFIVLGFSHLGLELLHEHSSRSTSLLQGIQLLNGNGDICDWVEGFMELGPKCDPVGLFGGAASVRAEACMAHLAA